MFCMAPRGWFPGNLPWCLLSEERHLPLGGAHRPSTAGSPPGLAGWPLLSTVKGIGQKKVIMRPRRLINLCLRPTVDNCKLSRLKVKDM